MMAVDSADAPLEAPRLPINQTLRGSDRSFLLTFKAAGEKPMYLCERTSEWYVPSYSNHVISTMYSKW